MSSGIYFIIALLSGAPIFVVLATTAIVFAFMTSDGDIFYSYVTQLHGGLNHFGLLAIPLFILVGEVMNEAGITRKLINMTTAIVGAVRSGQAYVNLFANGLMAAIIGSSVAQTAVMSRVMVPEMERSGYPRDVATAITCAGGLLGPLIPPSMPFIIFAVLAQVPVGDMFLAGIVPGLMVSLVFLVIIALLGHLNGYPKSRRVALKQTALITLQAVPSLMVPIAILAVILLGWGSPVDAAAIGLALSVVVGVVFHRQLSFGAMRQVLERTALNSALVLILVAAAGVFGWVITYQNVPQLIADYISLLASSPLSFLLIVALMLLAIGTVLDGVAAMIIVVPVLQPIAEGVYDIPTMYFGVVVVFSLVIGLLTPPVGASLYVAAGIANVQPWALFKRIIPYLLGALAVLVLLSVFPGVIDFWF